MKSIVLLLSLYVGAAMAQAPAAQREKGRPADEAIDDRATTAMKKMASFLRTLKSFSIVSDSTRDEIVNTDMKIQKSASNRVSVRLPDRLQADVHSDDHDLRFIYDGQTLTLFNSEKNYYATTAAPPTVARTLDAIRARHGIVFPLGDFIHVAVGEDLMKDVTEAGYIGTSRIDGVECDHLAIRQPEVDWQVWIERSATPVPRKLVITSKTKPTQPQYTARLTWNLAPQLDDTVFTFTPPADAVRIQFARSKNDGGEQ
jgi:hypothetical protein